MKRAKRTTRIYTSVPKLRTRASKKTRNEEKNTNDAENIASYDDTFEHIKGLSFWS